MFKAAGRVMVRIEDVMFAEPKFADGPNDFDICVHVVSVDDPSQADWWRGEVSNNYGKGNFSTMMQKDITLKTLRNVGFEGDDLTTLKDQVVGKEIPAKIKSREHEGKTYYSVQYIGQGGDAPVALDAGSLQTRMASMFGSAADNPAPAGAKAAATTTKPAGSPFGGDSAKRNPFAKK